MMLIWRRRPYLVVFSVTHNLQHTTLTEIFPIYFYARNNSHARKKVLTKLREWSTYNYGKLYKVTKTHDKFIGSIVR